MRVAVCRMAAVAAVAVALPVHADCGKDGDVCIGLSNQIVVSDRDILGRADRVRNMFGLHSLWWGVQDDLERDGEIRDDVVDQLKAARVSIIRHGGGANELDWRACTGPRAKRAPKKVAAWLPPISCMFGPVEYEALLDRLGVGVTWHLANIVGFDNEISGVNVLAPSEAGRAGAVAAKSGQRETFWELGNEVDRGRLKWGAEEILRRAIPIGAAIKKQVPNTKLVLPLIEFRPPWIPNERAHNRRIIEGAKGFADDFALHVYYDNPPQGPSVENRLRYIAGVSDLIERLKSPGRLWITEHGRWPQGDPSDKNWQRNWHQTDDADGVLSTSDFLIGLTQIDRVDGAMWHGLRAGPWNFLHVSKGGSVTPGGVAQLYTFLAPRERWTPQQTATTSVPMLTVPPVKYALRASAMRSSGDSKRLMVWVVNRSDREQDVTVRLSGKPVVAGQFKNARLSWMSSTKGGQFDVRSKAQKGGDGDTGSASIPARSVAVLEYSPQPLPGQQP